MVCFGTWKLEDARLAVKCAIEAGYRAIDAAYSYGNERQVAQGIIESGVERRELFITSKLWNTMRDFDKVQLGCRKSLRSLKTDYLDMYLIHWPASLALHENWRELNAETWRGMEALLDEGLVRAIGVSNFTPNQLSELLKTARTVPALNQIELHPGQPQTDAVDYCASKGIAVQAWSPLGSGEVLKNPVLIALAEKYRKSPAQICVRWCIQRGVDPVVRSSNASRIKENLDVFDFVISQSDMALINAIEYCGGSGLNSETIEIFG